MRIILCFIITFTLSICSEACAAIEISNPEVVFPSSRIIMPHKKVMFSARISPNGRDILFPQLVDAAQKMYRLVMLNTVTKEEFEIPLDLPEGYETVFTRFNFFNPKGDKLALFSMKQHPNSIITELVIYEIPSGKLIRTNLLGSFVTGQFDCTGECLLITQNDSYVTIAALDNLSAGQPLTPGWIHSCSPYSPYATVFVQPNPTRRQPGFTLLNLEDNTISQLPIHERNSKLDDVTSQWNLDGRYMFYVDVLQQNERHFDLITRVWDVTTNTEKATVQDALCIGPGPSDHLMLMTSTQGDNADGILVYDLNSGQLSPVELPSAKLIHAWKDRLLYVAPDGDASESIYIAGIHESN